jgi:hypothetical protein
MFLKCSFFFLVGSHNFTNRENETKEKKRGDIPKKKISQNNTDPQEHETLFILKNKVANTRKKWKNPCCKKSEKPSSVCQSDSSLENTIALYAGLFGFIITKRK